MTVWIIEPHDPLIFRDGRPFGPTPGARASSLSFPFPSTTAGGARTQAGLDGDGVFDVRRIAEVKDMHIRGPLLVQLEDDGRTSLSHNWLVPAPADAVLFPLAADPQKNEEIQPDALRKQLVPLAFPEGTWYSGPKLPSDVNALWPVGLPVPAPGVDSGKPLKSAPRYWYWEQLLIWLCKQDNADETLTAADLGVKELQRELRVHVSMDTEKRAGRDGALFDTSGMEFAYITGKRAHRLESARRLALAVAVDGSCQPRAGLSYFGSERRIVAWRECQGDLPICPPELAESIATVGACRMLLLTPAFFERGYYPQYLRLPRQNVTPNLRAIVVQRPQVVSGWDMEHGRRRPTRRLAPAGTVLYLTLDGSVEERKAWIRDTWMQCMSDDEQRRRDGFGLAVLGAWSGQRVEMDRKQEAPK